MKSYKLLKQTSLFFTYVALILFSLMIALPVLWTLRTSFVNEVDAYAMPPRLFPSFTFDNYRELFGNDGFGEFLINSLIISLASTAMAVPIASLGGYAFARYKAGGNILRFTVLATQMLPGVVLILPLFIVMSRLHLSDTYLGMTIAYLAFNLPFLIWIMTGFFASIPKDLDDAAAMDGLTPVQSFFRIILPIALPGIMATAVLSFIFSWNEFLFAIVLSGRNTMPIPVRLAAMKTRQGIQIAKLSAGTIIAIMPMVFISGFVKRYLISGLSLGAIKS
ncbi:MAG: carbohydrate ABC transporter permease [Spirochaetales bacterium]|nr:carbohydrate ABC transporter permease [Spirochaetales bacterium]